MNIPMEVLLDYMSHLNPEIHLDNRNMWINGIKLMPESDRLDPDSLYFSSKYSASLPIGQPPIVYVCPSNEKTSVPLVNCVVLHTDTPLAVIFNELLGAQDLVRTWVHDVELSICRCEGVQRLLDISGRVFGNPIAIMTSAYKTIAATWELETKDRIFRELLELGYLSSDNFCRLKELGCLEPGALDGKTHIFESNVTASHPYTITSINQDDSPGFVILMLCSNTPISPGIMQLYSYLIEKLRDYLQHATSSGDYMRSQFDYFIIDIIEGNISSQRDIIERSLVYPPAFQNECFTMLITHESSSTQNLEHAMQNLATLFPNVLILLHNKNILMYPKVSSKPEENIVFFDALNKYLQVNRAYAGVSEAFTGLENLHTSYLQAKNSLEIGRKLHSCDRVENMLIADNIDNRVFKFCDYHVYMLLSGQERQLGILDNIRRYDIDHNTDYYRILFIFLSFDRQYTKTAALLHMHRNNVIYHIGRICENFSLDLEDPGQRLRLLLLYYLRDLISAGNII